MDLTFSPERRCRFRTEPGDGYARCSDARIHRSFFRRGVSLRHRLPKVEVAMNIDWISATALVLSVLLLGYLAYSLLYPEKF
jgi:K+-transporting ATPase KdpF subunit